MTPPEVVPAVPTEPEDRQPVDPDLQARVALSRAVEPYWDKLLGAALARGLDPVGLVTALRAGAFLGTPAAGQAAQAASRLATANPLADLAAAIRCRARVLVPGDPGWPAWPPAMAVPPFALYVRGDRPLGELLRRSVAVVGARAATAYGDHVAGTLAYDLAAGGVTVVSGGAFGVDLAAHRGALAAGRPTVVVLAGGVDVDYPRAHAGLFARVLDAGGLIASELPPGCAPLKPRFLTRNRLIAGLTAGTVVVEAGVRSGALSTARHAARYGRAVMAVPGPVTSAMSAGCHQLLRDEPAARPVTRAAEVIEECGAVGQLALPLTAASRARDRLGEEAAAVLEALPARRAVPVSRLVAHTGLPAPRVLRALALLAVGDLAEEVGVDEWRLGPAGREPIAG